MKQKDVLFIFGSLCLLTIAWIVFSIAHSTLSSTTPQTVTTEVSPIDPNFDLKTIERLRKRQKVTPVFTVINSKTSSKTSTSPSPVQETKKVENATQSSFLQ